MERGDGGMASRGCGVVGSAAMLGLDMHLAPQQMHPVAFQQQPDHQHHVGGGGGGFQLQQPAPVRHQQQPSSFSPYSTSSSRVVTAAASHDEDMAGNGCGGKGGAVQPQQQVGAAGCPWTRMKWTDAMVRLLIRVVYSVGDDGEGLAAAGGGAGGKAAAGPHGKAAHGHGHAAAQQQKKGKWKSVSRAMMDNGFLVSPQQCEDKFNDLNKRYKRVVDLLGRGRACRVVENHALLDTIDELTPKAKDEARKLLSSKHLFFREMCAYHNSGAAHAAAPHLPPHAAGDAAACLHHPPPAPMAVAASSAARQEHGAPSPPGTKDSSADAADGDDDSEDGVSNNEDEDEDDYDEDEDGHMYQNQRLHHHHHHHNHRGGGGRGKRGRGADDSAAGEDFEDDDAVRKRTWGEQSAAVQELQSELASATAADPQAARGWVRRRAGEVEEHQVTLEWRAHQLERQRLKWERFRTNKERDMERARLRNDRLRLDGQRMLLMLRHRDLELDMAEANTSSVDHHSGQGPLAVHPN